jgi:HicA toxin of bacterial toxin-antitoxin,
MSKAEKLLQRAINSRKNLKFEDLCSLAECYGWVFQRQSGSHRIYMHPGCGNRFGSMMNFQPRDGKAKPSQVTQLLNAIEALEDG